MFVDRTTELAVLTAALESPRAELVIIYGRRRVGKTELLKQLLVREPRAVYVLGRNETPHDLLRRLSHQFAVSLDDERLLRFPFRDLDEMFTYVRERHDLVLILDEFPFMVSSEPAFLSVLQDYWDNHLRSTGTKLFLTGSVMGMVERMVFDYSSPIYGRRTRQLKLEPLAFSDLDHFFPGTGFDERLRIYSVLGGTPGYLLEYEDDLMGTIRDKILKKDQFLYKDAEFVLRAELREPRFYFSIIRAIASGNTTLGLIMNDTGLTKDVASKYIGVLCDLDIITRQWPVTEDAKTRKGVYRIKDHYFRFYFRFVYPYLEYIELGNTDRVLDLIDRQFPHYLGSTFETVVLELLAARPGLLPFVPTRTGKWWQKNDEIDFIAIDDRTDQICFGEMKYTTSKVGPDVFRKLKIKSSKVNWHTRTRKDHFLIVSKSGFKAPIPGVLCYTPDDILPGS